MSLNRSVQFITRVRKFLRLNPNQQKNLVLGVMHGSFIRHHIDMSGTFLSIDRRVRIQKHFGSIRFGNYVRLGNGCALVVVGLRSRQARLVIGDESALGDRTRINATAHISIGSRCSISWHCDIMDTDFHHVISEEGLPLDNSSPVVIEDRVWIGCGSTILKGTRIGHDSVVGAGSVVSGVHPPFSLIIGNPGRAVKKIGGWRRS